MQLCIYFVRVVPPVSHFAISQPVSYRGTGTSQDKRADMSRGVTTTAGLRGRTPRGTSMGREKKFRISPQVCILFHKPRTGRLKGSDELLTSKQSYTFFLLPLLLNGWEKIGCIRFRTFLGCPQGE